MAIIRLLNPGEVPTALLGNAQPQELDGASSPGVSTFASRSDHKHSDEAIKVYVNGLVSTRTRKLEFELNFTTQLRTGKATIPIPELLVGDSIAIFQSGNAPSGRSSDENEMDLLVGSARCVTAGFANIVVHSLLGPVAGRYKFVAIY